MVSVRRSIIVVIIFLSSLQPSTGANPRLTRQLLDRFGVEEIDRDAAK
ncbi:hypothetical protein N44_04021 [Microcystis aeruginosa NIES-44]|uniref:Uncharacterized protein n=1 Tax=Microcystis aeruginosa NIES-44 TaxID=449439 RepID=A0A0A1W0V3_MICAE|nr:hypothetical protein N44_04021 [Microcystis aeruginosa NIES-44]